MQLILRRGLYTILALPALIMVLGAAPPPSLPHAASPTKVKLPAGQKSSTRCRSARQNLDALAAGLTFNIARRSAATAEGIKISWRLSSRPPKAVGHTYLMFDTPEAVRFAGTGFYALAPGAAGPAGISKAKGRPRLIIPLHVPNAKTNGKFEVRAYRAGSLPITATLATKGPCGEIIATGKSQTINVTYGRPEVVIQDVFSDDKPEKTILANNGRYRLLVFADRYQVFDVKTGAKIIDRIGVEPNFSPTGRYIVAKGYSREQLQVPLSLAVAVYHDVIDLVTGELILNDVTGPIGWTNADSFIIDGGVKGHFSIRHTLVDRPGSQRRANREAPLFDQKNWNQGTEPDPKAVNQPLAFDICWWKGCPEWRESYGAFINIDDGYAQVFAERGVDGKVFYLVDLSNNQIVKFGKRECNVTSGETTHVNCKKIALPSRPTDATRLCCSNKSQWLDAKRTMPLTHLHDWLVGGDTGTDPKLAARIVKHRSVPANGSIQVAAAGGAKVVRGGWRGAGGLMQPPPQQAVGKSSVALFDRLRDFGIDVDPGIKPLFIKPALPPNQDYSKTEAEIEASLRKSWQPYVARIARDIPVAQQILAPGGGSSCAPIIGRGKIGLNGIIASWQWRLPDHTVWMFQGFCSVGTTPFTPFIDLNLLVAKNGEPGHYRPLVPGYEDANADYSHYRISKVLLDRAMSKVPGAGQEFDKSSIPIAIAKAISREPARVRMTSDGMMLLPIASQLVIYNVKSDKVVRIIDGLIAHSNDLDVYFTKDRRHILQFNADGRLAVFSFATGKRVLAGRYIDDEIILYDANGYYDATYEGGHFVNLKFPGDFGLYSFQQFKSQLHRPKLINARLTGNAGSERPKLSVPPEVNIELAAAAAGQFTAKVTARSSSGLQVIRIYQDGQLLKQVPASGARFEQRVELQPRPGTRWITASAVDRLGFVSRPVANLLRDVGAAAATLRAAVVGIDAYDEPGLAPLSYAAADSNTIAASLRSINGRYYGNVDIRHLTNRAASPHRILQDLKSVVDQSRPGDTVLFFFAGHGVRGDDGKYYLATTETDARSPAGNALEWTKVKSVLARSKARVIVLLDACHSGLAGSEAFASNDDAVAQFLTGVRVPILVLAASKGRQFSQERASLGGGVFTRAIEAVLSTDRSRYDLNNNGVIEVSELYLGVKTRVKSQTSGEQTPWLARSDMVGDFALF